MKQNAYALGAGFGTNVVGYLLSLGFINLFHNETPSPLWAVAPMLWLAFMILGGWVASVVAGGRRFLLGYLSAALGMLVVVLMMRFVLRIDVPLLATAAGVVIFSALGALGALTYSRKAK